MDSKTKKEMLSKYVLDIPTKHGTLIVSHGITYTGTMTNEGVPHGEGFLTDITTGKIISSSFVDGFMNSPTALLYDPITGTFRQFSVIGNQVLLPHF